MAKWFQRRNTGETKEKRKPVKTIKIQAAKVEGYADPVVLESLITATRFNTSIPGTSNAYKLYENQTREIYKKYNGWADFGVAQVRAAIDIRTAFISGEGVSVSAENDATAKWIDDFLIKNNLRGERFTNAIKGTEMSGQTIIMMRPAEWFDGSLYVRTTRVPYSLERPYRATFKDPFIKEELEAIEFKVEGLWQKGSLGKFVYVRTGGDDFDTRGPTTKVGVVLTDCENYDRALKDMRRNNHILARITPHFKTTSSNESKSLRAKLNEMRWRIGQAFIGTADFKYVTPGQGAHENLETEMVSTIKTISSVTGIPVHWLGYVDLMSNRATADNLYEMVKHATISERVAWERAMFELIIKAQEVYINSGGTELPALDRKIQVTLPLIDFSQFKERVEALSLAYRDEAISMADYRGALPGIDPLVTERAVKAEQDEAINQLVKSGLPTMPTEGDDDGEEETD